MVISDKTALPELQHTIKQADDTSNWPIHTLP
ncbi:hypothetical protein T06_5673 [Trichinella sp. T6]|nr:hypothetical protein T06_5673 [Trichinella sp. T6]